MPRKAKIKTLNFNNVLKCKRLREVVPGQRFATFRLLYVPTYIVGEIIGIKDSQNLVKKKTKTLWGIKEEDIFEPKILYLAKVEGIIGKFLYQLTYEDACLDLFPDKTAEQFRSEILSMYRGKTEKHFGIQSVLSRVEANNGIMNYEFVEADAEEITKGK